MALGTSNTGPVNGKLVMVLLSMLMFSLGLIVAGLGMMVRGDFLGNRQAELVKYELNQRLDRQFSALDLRLARLEEVDRKLTEIGFRLDRIEGIRNGVN